MKNSLVYLVQQLLLKNNISFDKKEVSFQIQSHPSYPSLHAVTGVLSHFNIENIAAKVPCSVETMLELPSCFIAEIETDNGKELVTVLRKKLNFFFSSSSKKKERNTASQFLEKFTGIIVAVEKNEEENRQVSSAFNTVLIGVLALLTVCVLLIATPTISTTLFFLTSLIGVVISVSVVKQELGITTVIGNAFCSSSNEKKDCEAVLTSKGAMLFKNYKLSDFSLIYFLAMSVAVFLIAIQKASPLLLYLISVIALPVTFYSIYYQYKVVKKWCFLCLSIVGVLWFQALFFFLNTASSFSFEELLVTVFCFVAVFAGWNFFKPRYIELVQGEKTKIEYFKFKRNLNLFSKLLGQSPKIETNILDTSEIIFGNEQSTLEIVIVTNPFCGHCKPVHELIEKMIHEYDNEVKIVIRFNVNTKDMESDAVRVTSKLLEIYHLEGKRTCLKAMSAIYEGTSVDKWFNTWGNRYEKEKYFTTLESQKKWCLTNTINFTPEILVNGNSFPKEYGREDLIYFIEDLNENDSVTPVLKAV